MPIVSFTGVVARIKRATRGGGICPLSAPCTVTRITGINRVVVVGRLDRQTAANLAL